MCFNEIGYVVAITKMQKKIGIISLIVLILLILIGVKFYSARQFEVTHPTKGNITEAVYGLGKVKSNNRYEVIIGIISTVTQRFVNEGDFVKKNAPLIKFNDDTLFRAPFSGTITLANLYPGETALPNKPLLRLEDLSQRYLELSLEQQSILHVKVGQPAQVSFESLRGQVLAGHVTAIFPREDEFLARVSVDGLNETILPGMTADVTIEVGSIQNATLVPLAAVRSGVLNVFRQGSWQKIKVEVGRIDGLFAEIKSSDLTPSDQIRYKVEK